MFHLFYFKHLSLGDGWILNIPTLSWCKLDYLPLNRPRLWHTANLSSEEEIVIFGGCHNNILDYTLNNVSMIRS
jgi:hypothetical protein